MFARAVLLAMSTLGMALHASTMYSFSGAGFLAGTSFVVNSPTYLSYSTATQNTPDSGYLVENKQAKGAISDVIFFYGNQAAGNTAIGISTVSNSYVAIYMSYNVGADGVYVDSSGTLTIQSTPGVTPEPSSLLLLGTGLLGTVAAVRRRLTA